MTKQSKGRPLFWRQASAVLGATLFCLATATLPSAERTDQSSSDHASASQSGGGFGPFQPPKVRYDTEYPGVGYSSVPRQNAIARLQERLDRGELKLQFQPPHGYLRSLLQALEIDLSSQTLVYSKTSLQSSAIRAATPRAIYFNDHTYVGWTQDTDLIEIGTMDDALGQVFYTLPNRSDAPPRFEREMERCLSCHDTYSLTGGGVPRFLLMSTYTGINGNQLTHEGSIVTSDKTPIRYRWGGWYVTGQHGDQVHLGNIQVRSAYDLENLDSVRRGNLTTLDGLFDTKPYLTGTSDIVALMVLQHQTHIQNLITRVNFEVRAALAKEADGNATGKALKLSPQTEEALRGHMEELVQAMLLVDAAKITSRITGTSGFDAWFQAQGPRDAKGRSLRELDLTTRLFKYPLSYTVYSPGFDGLPDYARAYIYRRFAEILRGQDRSESFAHLSAADRKALLEILTETKPEFAQSLKSRRRT